MSPKPAKSRSNTVRSGSGFDASGGDYDHEKAQYACPSAASAMAAFGVIFIGIRADDAE